MGEFVFNPNTDRAIGRVNKKLKKDSASIEVLGIIHNDNVVEKLPSYARMELFPYKGLAFAPSFHNHSMVKESLKADGLIFSFFCYEEPVEDHEKDLMKIDYERQINSLVPVLIKDTTKGFINLRELYGQVEFPPEIASFYLYDKSNEILYVQFIRHADRIEPFNGKEVKGYEFSKEMFGNSAFQSGGTSYLYIPEEFGSQDSVKTIDCMNSDQLGKWYANRIKKLVGCDDQAIGTIKRSLEVVLSDEDELTQVRVSRIRDNINQFELDIDAIDGMLTESSVIGKQLSSLWDERKEDLKNTLIAENSETLQQRRNEIRAEEEKLSALIDDKSKIADEIITMNDEVTSLEHKIVELERQQDFLVQSAVISAKAILRSDNANSESSKGIVSSKKIELLEINNGSISLSKSGKDVKAYLNQNEGMNLASLLPSLASFIPDASVAYHLAYTLNRTKLLHINIEPTWFSYDDLVQRGITELWNTCFKEPEYNYILLLDNINIGICDAFAKPLLDVIGEKRTLLPLSAVREHELPKNLFILATLAPVDEGLKIGLPLNRDLFFQWDCFTYTDEAVFSLHRIDQHKKIYILPSNYKEIRNTGVAEEDRKNKVDEYYGDFFGN